MGSDEALTVMGLSNRRAIPTLIEEGRCEAYRLVIGAPWRISRPSFAEYVAAVRRRTSSAAIVGDGLKIRPAPGKKDAKVLHGVRR
jgi:hypothetical protein